MHMGIDQAWNEGPASKIYLRRFLSREHLYLLSRSDLDDPVADNGYCFGD